MSLELHVDWTKCRARGLCWELLPEVLEPDDWGYPLATTTGHAITVPDRLRSEAEEAVTLCPRLALRLARS